MRKDGVLSNAGVGPTPSPEVKQEQAVDQAGIAKAEKAWCCKIGCKADAVFYIEAETITRANWEDGTDACAAHLGELVETLPGWPMAVRVVPVEGR